MKHFSLQPLFQRAGVYLLSSIVTALIPFALLPVLTRLLGATEYGRVALFQMAVSGIAALFGMSLASACTRKCYDADLDDRQISEYIGTVTVLLAAALTATALAVWLSRSLLSSSLGLDPAWLLLATLVATMNAAVAIRLGQWQARSHARHHGLFQISVALLGAGVSLGLVVGFGLGASGPILAQSLVTALAAAIGMIMLSREGRFSITFNPAYAKEALAYGLPLVPHLAGYFLLRSVDRAVINHQLGMTEVGIYVVAMQISLTMRLAFDAFNLAFVPWLFAQLESKNAPTASRIVTGTYTYFVIALLGAATLHYTAPLLVRVLAGPEFAAAEQVVGWLALAQALYGMYLMVTNYVLYAKRTGRLSIITTTCGGINIGLLLMLTPLYGIEGAAIACVLASLLRFLLTWWLACNSHPMPWFGSSRGSTQH